MRADSRANSPGSKNKEVLTKTLKKEIFAKSVKDSLQSRADVPDSGLSRKSPKSKSGPSDALSAAGQKIKFSLKQAEKPRFATLDAIIPRIKKKIRECIAVGAELQTNYNLSQSEKMISEYESFRFQNLLFLNELVEGFAFKGSHPESTKFVLKFLLDVQRQSDLRRLSCQEVFFLEYFLVNRYFKVLRNKVLRLIEKSARFQEFLRVWGFAPLLETLGEKEMGFGCVAYKRTVALWKENSNAEETHSAIFNKGFSAEIASLLGFCEPRKLYESFAVRFYNLIQALIAKFIVSRFGNSQLIFDEVECIDKDISELLDMLLGAWSTVRRQAGPDPRSGDLERGVRGFAEQLASVFPREPRSTLFDLIKYIKFREMREYLERKKKSKFVRYRRNDEKIKKIYKHIMIRVYSDFKDNRPESNSNSPLPRFGFKPGERDGSQRNLEPEAKGELGKRKSLSGEARQENKVGFSTFWLIEENRQQTRFAGQGPGDLPPNGKARGRQAEPGEPDSGPKEQTAVLQQLFSRDGAGRGPSHQQLLRPAEADSGEPAV